MEDSDLHKIPLTTLSFEARELLSCLLNTQKILLSEGPDKLPRDWRGLASLVGISSEIANSYESDKTSKVLEYWIQQKHDSATVGKLLEFVQRIGRYDIFDDFMELATRGKLVVNRPYRPPEFQNNAVATVGGMQVAIYEDDIDEELITFDDKIHGAPQFYHAYILYAHEDRDFVDEMLIRMREKNYKLCTEDDLLPDHSTTFAPVSRLISSNRCHRIILIYSPDFLTSPANNFYMDYAQAVGIEMRRPKIIPCMFRQCNLPSQVTFYHKLYYNPPGSKMSYDFWDRLSYSLDTNNTAPRLLGLNSSLSMTTSYSTLNITEMLPSSNLANNLSIQRLNGLGPNNLLALTAAHNKSVSMNGINKMNSYKDDGKYLSGASHNHEAKKYKKPSRIKKMINSLNNSLRLKKRKDEGLMNRKDEELMK